MSRTEQCSVPGSRIRQNSEGSEQSGRPNSGEFGYLEAEKQSRMTAEAEQSLTKGLAWLLAQQAADGGWHSKTYGQVKDGAAVTALALEAHSLAGTAKPP